MKTLNLKNYTDNRKNATELHFNEFKEQKLPGIKSKELEDLDTLSELLQEKNIF